MFSFSTKTKNAYTSVPMTSKEETGNKGFAQSQKGSYGKSLVEANRRKKSQTQNVYILIFLILVSYIFLSVIVRYDGFLFPFDTMTVNDSLYGLNKVILDKEFNDERIRQTPTPAPPAENTSSKEDVKMILDASTTQLLDLTESSINLLENERMQNESESLANLKIMSCRVPKLNPFDPSIKHIMTEPEPINCTEEYPLLFSSTLNSTLIFVGTPKERTNLTSCCYKTVERANNSSNPDNTYTLSKPCYPVNIKETLVTVIPPDHDYVTIYCKFRKGNELEGTEPEVMDMHEFPHEKPFVEERVYNYYKNVESLITQNNGESKKDVPLLENNRLSVVILGIDAVSHMNFLRTMPNTYEFLKNNLSAIEMQGFNKVGDNTFPNIAAALTSNNISSLKANCMNKNSFDKCPFIWKEYSANGYRTSYGEDATWMGIFNYLLAGFKNPPVDYYLRPFHSAAEKLIGNNRALNANLCYGPRLTFESLLDYTKKLATTMRRKKRYFQFIWATSLTHDYINFAKLGDKPLFSTLKWFNDEGHLNNTAFVLMSDHGIRWGKIMDHPQGKTEVNLPFLYFILPQWFKERYERAFNNLKENQDRLTTPFDVYETLTDLLYLNKLQESVLISREQDLEKMATKMNIMPRGISQFVPLPLSRTCKMAGIEEHFCSCHHLKEVNVGKPEIGQAANYIVHHINLMVSHYPQCAYLNLQRIITAHLIQSDTKEVKNENRAYQLLVATVPGNGHFEASVARNKYGVWSVSGVITRTNLYGNQSHCVNEKDLKLYCYCINDDLIEMKK